MDECKCMMNMASEVHKRTKREERGRRRTVRRRRMSEHRPGRWRKGFARRRARPRPLAPRPGQRRVLAWSCLAGASASEWRSSVLSASLLSNRRPTTSTSAACEVLVQPQVDCLYKSSEKTDTRNRGETAVESPPPARSSDEHSAPQTYPTLPRQWDA